jgi:hypothetical protein
MRVVAEHDLEASQAHPVNEAGWRDPARRRWPTNASITSRSVD